MKEPPRSLPLLLNAPPPRFIGIYHSAPQHLLLGSSWSWQPDVPVEAAADSPRDSLFRGVHPGKSEEEGEARAREWGEKEVSSSKAFLNIPTSEKTETQGVE